MLQHLIVWIIVGLIGGGFAGSLIKREKRGFGIVRNLALGLAGAVVGGLLFRGLDLFAALDGITISLRDVVAAFVGSLVVLVIIWIWKRYK